MYSQKQYYSPKRFCHAFKDLDGNATNVLEQMDVDEFSNLLMDRLEHGIKGSGDEDLIKKHFGGIISNEIICRTCPHSSEREEPFFALSLPVKNKKSVELSLRSLIQGDVLEGDNAYHCDQCEKKVAAVKRTCLKRLPNHLIMVLKRFDFDFDTMAKTKVNDRCEFPIELSLEQFSQQALKRMESRAKEGDVEYPESYFKYQLNGVVVHMGSADSGHYYSFVRDREKTGVPEDKRWYEFNDTQVTFSDINSVINDGYGGSEYDRGGGGCISLGRPRRVGRMPSSKIRRRMRTCSSTIE
jgi:ubiquitin C-terminal hydrolase